MEAYYQDGKIGIATNDDTTASDKLSICCNCLERIATMYGKDINEVINKFSTVAIDGYENNYVVDWDDVLF